MVITDDLMNQGLSARNPTWNRRQLGVLGLPWPPKKGWRRALLGKKITEKQLKEFLRLEDRKIGEDPVMDESNSNWHRATDLEVTEQFLKERVQHSARAGFPKAKWIEFCEEMLKEGFQVTLYEARKTVSKYITVGCGGRYFVVRFSNHWPARSREDEGSCDFFVGKNNNSITSTWQAIWAVRDHMKSPRMTENEAEAALEADRDRFFTAQDV